MYYPVHGGKLALVLRISLLVLVQEGHLSLKENQFLTYPWTSLKISSAPIVFFNKLQTSDRIIDSIPSVHSISEKLLIDLSFN